MKKNSILISLAAAVVAVGAAAGIAVTIPKDDDQAAASNPAISQPADQDTANESADSNATKEVRGWKISGNSKKL